MHYQHQFHAGNFADVVKHLCVFRILQLLNRKPAPWCVIDTHAGAGSYPLYHPASARTGEWLDGIGRLRAAGPAPAVVSEFLSAVERCNGEALRPDHTPRLYPGSPWLAIDASRPGDNVQLFESVEFVTDELRIACRAIEQPGGRYAIHCRDGYEAYSLLPLPQKRGLVLIDPPFERADEFAAIETLLERTLGRFANGIHVIWYPQKQQFHPERFIRRVRSAHPQPMLQLRFDNGAPSAGQMHACGLLIINPPHPLHDDLDLALAWLLPRLAQSSRAGFDVVALPPTSSASRKS